MIACFQGWKKQKKVFEHIMMDELIERLELKGFHVFNSDEYPYPLVKVRVGTLVSSSYFYAIPQPHDAKKLKTRTQNDADRVEAVEDDLNCMSAALKSWTKASGERFIAVRFDNRWRRGIIVGEVLNKGKIRILLLDLGQVIRISSDKLRLLPDFLIRPPYLGVKIEIEAKGSTSSAKAKVIKSLLKTSNNNVIVMVKSIKKGDKGFWSLRGDILLHVTHDPDGKNTVTNEYNNLNHVTNSDWKLMGDPFYEESFHSPKSSLNDLSEMCDVSINRTNETQEHIASLTTLSVEIHKLSLATNRASNEDYVHNWMRALPKSEKEYEIAPHKDRNFKIKG